MSESVACIVYEGGRLLVARRKPSGDMGGRWEFPGGKLDAGENDAQAVVREMREEFGVKATPRELIAEGGFEHKGKRCSVRAYAVTLEHDGVAVPYALTEHTEYKWVRPLEIRDLNFVDSDRQLYPQVLRFLGIAEEE